MKIVLSPNPYRDKGLRVVQSAERILKSVGVDTCVCLPFQPEKGSRLELGRSDLFSDMDQQLKDADVLVCFGGDGTILHAAKCANACGVPILGVNLGSVGFMAELEQGELSLLNKLAAGKYSVEIRMMVDVKVFRQGHTVFRDTALNDAVVTKGAVARVIDLSVLADRTHITDFSGDGVIVSTPTGSTAYSMSAGGPIVEPTAENILVTPICPHALQARAFVLDGDRTVTVKVGKLGKKTAYISVDGGKAAKLVEGDCVEIRRSAAFTKLVRLTGRSFYDVVSHKLGGVNK